MCSRHGALNGLCVIRRCYPCIDRFGAPQLMTEFAQTLNVPQDSGLTFSFWKRGAILP